MLIINISTLSLKHPLHLVERPVGRAHGLVKGYVT
jgi:hypothetical protein